MNMPAYQFILPWALMLAVFAGCDKNGPASSGQDGAATVKESGVISALKAVAACPRQENSIQPNDECTALEAWNTLLESKSTSEEAGRDCSSELRSSDEKVRFAAASCLDKLEGSVIADKTIAQALMQAVETETNYDIRTPQLSAMSTLSLPESGLCERSLALVKKAEAAKERSTVSQIVSNLELKECPSGVDTLVDLAKHSGARETAVGALYRVSDRDPELCRLYADSIKENAGAAIPALQSIRLWEARCKSVMDDVVATIVNHFADPKNVSEGYLMQVRPLARSKAVSPAQKKKLIAAAKKLAATKDLSSFKKGVAEDIIKS